MVSPTVIDIFAFSSSTGSESLLLLVASQNQILADNITSQFHNIYSIVQNGSHIVALDFDSISGRVFWSDGSQGKIWSAFQNGTDRRVVSTFLLIFGLTSPPVLGLLLLLVRESRSYLILGSSHIPLWATWHPRGLDVHNSQYMGVLDKNVTSEGRSMILNSRSHDAETSQFFFFLVYENRGKCRGVKKLLFFSFNLVMFLNRSPTVSVSWPLMVMFPLPLRALFCSFWHLINKDILLACEHYKVS